MNNTIINAKDVCWIENGKKATFISKTPGYSIVNEEGLILAKNGSPCVWRTKSAASTCAPYANEFANHSWIEFTIN